MKDDEKNDLVERTTMFGLRIVKMFVALPMYDDNYTYPLTTIKITH